MAHDHTHGHNHATGNIVLAFFLNLGFAIIELIGGLYTNSIAILSDALHDFGDSLSLGVAWILQKKSERKPDQYYSYGYKRFSLLGAIFISLVLIVGSVFIIRECIERIITPQEPDATGMLWLAVFGILVNGAAALRLRRGSSMNEHAVSLHMLEDVLGWAAVLVVSIVMHFVYLPILDPLLSVAISLWVLYNAFRNFRPALKIFLQHIPQNVNLPALEDKILLTQGVTSIHDVHLWSLDGEHHIITMHVVTSSGTNMRQLEKIKLEIRTLCKEFGIGHTTLEFETEGSLCDYEECDPGE